MRKERNMSSLGDILGHLGASRRRLGDLLAVYACAVVGTVVGKQRAPIGSFRNFLDIIRNIRKDIRIRILLKTPLGGVPPPLVFEVGRFVAWKEVLKECVGKLRVFFQVARNALGLERFWHVLGRSWAAPGNLGRLLGGSWAVLGGSWAAPGPSWALLGCLGRLLAVLGRLLGGSWALLGTSGAILAAKLEPRWTPRGAKSSPRPSKIEAKTVQDSLDM